MKSDFLSLSELADLWERKYNSIKSMSRRGKFTSMVYLREDEALRLGLQWSGKATRTRQGRPYISISDSAIPDHVRKKYYELKLTTHGPSGPQSLTGAGQASAPVRAKGEPNPLLHPTSPEATHPGKDQQSSAPAVGNNHPLYPPDTRNRQLPDSCSSEETPVLRDGASLQSPGDEGTHSPGPSYELEAYRQLPDYARRQVDKYLPLVRETAGMSRAETEEAIARWNSEHPEFAMSSRSLRLAKKRYRERGVAGLASQRGARAGHTIVRDEWLEYFRSLYLKEGAPSAESCWVMTRGKFPREKAFPVAQTFVYQLRRRMPADAIYLARYGEAAWNRKYGMYLERDYSNIICGEVWVSDHAQIDVAVADADGKPFFPWITAWRDMKSGKWLGWLIHREPPNSDHVFQSFYYACRDFGIPKHIYIDNGKDYRAKDFTGGRTKSGKIRVKETAVRSVCAAMGVSVHFALPYNAQAKNIERDFLKQKETFAKHMPGYRGGHSKERPEALAGEIRRGKILAAAEFGKLLSAHLFYNLNRAPSRGKALRGLCPDELYEREAHNEFVSPESLSILCMRVSGSRAVGRNGVRDSRSKETYFAEWMLGSKGRKVYLRRDPSDTDVAWVFDARSDEYLGKGYRVSGIPAIAVGEEQKVALASAMADKRTARRVAKAYASDMREIPPLEKVANMAVGNALLSGYGPGGGRRDGGAKEIPLADAVIEKERLLAKDGKADYSAVAPPRREPRRIYQSRADREREEAERKLLEEEKKNAGT